MTRPLTVLAIVLGLAACGDAPAGKGGVSGDKKTAQPKVDPALIISGVVTAPEGHDLTGAKILACLTPRETCLKEAEGAVVVTNGVGRYELKVPAAGDYHLTVWKDVNANETPDSGDLLAFAHNMEAVPSGQRLTPMTAFVRVGDGPMTTNAGGNPMGAESDLLASAQAVRTAGLGGRWSQSSVGSELVWGPEIKFQASSATVGFGTNLGGTFGAGSPTNTTIVYSYKPVQMRRSMTLDVRPDGSFHWTSTLERRQGKCRSAKQEKFGRVKVEGDKLTFVVADTRQRCGSGVMETLKAEDETYTLVRGGQGFRLTGERGINWAFSRAG